MPGKKYFCCLLFLFSFIPLCWGWSNFVVDNDDGAPAYVETGEWTTSGTAGYNGGTYQFVLASDPPATATWTPDILNAGNYDVYAIFLASTNRPTDAPYTIVHRDGTTEVSISQYAPSMQMREVHLGAYYFEAGTSGYVRLSNSGSNGAYIADAVRFVTVTDNPPSISEVEFFPFPAEENEPINVTASITSYHGLTEVKVIYEAQPSGTSGELSAYDDGNHGDGTPGNGIFGAYIPGQPSGSTVSFYFSATDILEQTTTSSPVTVNIDKPEYRALWVDTWNPGMLSYSQIDDLFTRARANNFNTLVVEIRKAGDAYYTSELVPRAENIIDEELDPLAYIIEKAHDTSGGQERIQVHAWLVVNRVWKGSSGPADPSHIFYQHPEWFSENSSGAIHDGQNNYFLEMGVPEAAQHFVDVIVEVVENYNVDGINLDYVRYPESNGPWGYNPIAIDRFESVYPESGPPSESNPDWLKFKRDNVTELVRKIFVEINRVNPNVLLSADTITWGAVPENFENSASYAGVFQDWVLWMKDGYVDINMPMIYKREHVQAQAEDYRDWVDFSIDHAYGKHFVAGLGTYLNTVEGTLAQMDYASKPGTDGFIFFSYNATNASGVSRDDFFATIKSEFYSTWVDPPQPEWKTSPVVSIVEGTVTMDGIPVDHCRVILNGDPETAVYTNGLGWYGTVQVPPGVHQLTFIKGEIEKSLWVNVTEAGEIYTMDTDLFSANIDDWCLY